MVVSIVTVASVNILNAWEVLCILFFCELVTSISLNNESVLIVVVEELWNLEGLIV